jgi:hypothetical protein
MRTKEEQEVNGGESNGPRKAFVAAKAEREFLTDHDKRSTTAGSTVFAMASNAGFAVGQFAALGAARSSDGVMP